MEETPTPARLNRERIVDAAVDYIDAHGAQQLTMRKLGAQLSVEAMAIYRHLEGREAVLEAVVQRVMSGVTHGLDSQLSSTWQGYLQDMAHRIRSVALQHPRVFPLVATRHPSAPWIRPPLRDLEVIEHFLTRLTDCGFTAEQAVFAYQSFSSFLLGHLFLEVMQAGAQTAPVGVPLNEGSSQVPTEDDDVEVADFPTLTSMSSLLSQDSSEEQLEIGLEALIDRLELMITGE